jgi:signal transduction histidine kinase/HAMP domain-containing protein
MSQTDPKYKRLESLLSTKPVDPDPVRPPANEEVDALKAQIAELEAASKQPPGQPSRPAAAEIKTQPVPPPFKSAGGEQERTRQALLKDATSTNAYRVTLIGLPASIVGAALCLYLALTMGAWQLYVWSAEIWLLALAVLTSMILIRRGRVSGGAWLLLAAIQVTFIGTVALIEGIGLLVGVCLAILVSVIAGQALSAKSASRAIIMGVVSGVAAILLDLFGPAFRFPQPDPVRVFLPGVLGILILLYGLGMVRQFSTYSLRTKLVLIFVLVAVGSAGSVALIVNRSLRTNLTDDIGNNLAVLAHTQALQIDENLDNELNLLKALALSKAIQDRAELASATNSLSPSQIDQLDQEWRIADAADNNSDPLVAGVLNDSLSPELLKYQAAFPENVEVFLTDLQGVSIATTDRTSDYLQSDEEWWQLAYRQGEYIAQPEYDASSKTLAINMAVPVRARGSDRITGILRTTVNINSLGTVLGSGRFGQTGRTDVYLPDGQEITLAVAPDGTYELTVDKADPGIPSLLQQSQTFYAIALNGVPSLLSTARVADSDISQQGRIINNLDWYVITHQDQAEALKPVENQTNNILFLAMGIAILAAIAAAGLAQVLAGPIVRLKNVAANVAAGNLGIEARVETADEIGALAAAFNNMVSQLRNLIGSLEQRVVERTQDLEVAAEVARAVGEKTADIDGLLNDAVELISERFHLYYTQLYLADPAGQILTLRAGSGEVGAELLRRGHRLPIGSGSINGRAAAEKISFIVADTSQSADFKPNPLLPDTRCEMSIPLIASGKVVGVLDMQSRAAGALSETNLPAFEALAGQLAIALQNAALLVDAEKSRDELEAYARRFVRTGWGEYLNAVQRPERIGYVFDQNGVGPIADAGGAHSSNGQALTVPIAVIGETLGTFSVELEKKTGGAETAEFLNAVARQVSQQIENLRLLESAQQYRSEAENAVRRLTREGWDVYLKSGGEQAPGYMFDLTEVKVLDGNGNGRIGGVLKYPLAIRNETVGELAADVEASSDEVAEIIAAVAEQTSIHIETLRLTQELQKRAAELQELDRLKTAFLANMSHELRTPLNSILGFADVILEELDGPLTDNMNNDLQLIQKNGQHLLNLINDVLDMAKIEAGRMNLNPERFKITETIEEVVSITSPLASEKALSLFIDEDSDREVEVVADRTRIRQVMLNLVNNALKFTEMGKISLRVGRQGEKILIRVRDTGMGIPPDKLEAVFQEFTQVDTSATRKTGGTGLGLPISRRLIDMHGGRMWAESTGVPGQGATFYVELPIEARIVESMEKLTR